VKRFTEDPRTKSEILSRNEGVKLLRNDVFVRVPYRLLSENYRRIAIEALFPGDTTDAQGWVHRVSALTGKPESLWRIAEWFTGDPGKYREIREAGAIPSLEVDFSAIDFTSRKSVLGTADVFENLGVGAYNGAAPSLKSKQVLASAGTSSPP